MGKPILNFIPFDYSNPDKHRIVKGYYYLLLSLITGFSIFLVERIFTGDPVSFVIILATLVFLLFSLFLVYRRILKPIIFMITISLVVVITLLSTIGQGIHDISTIGYPIILIIAILLLKRHSFYFITAMLLACIAWLVFGSAAGLYTPRPHGNGDLGDFVLVGTMLLIAAFATFQIRESIRFSLEQAAAELQEKENLGRALQTNLGEKELLLKEIHHRVKNTMNVVISLINLQKGKIESKEKYLEVFQDISNRIYSIALVHDRLYTTGDLSHINMKEYIEIMIRHLSAIFDTGGQIKIVSTVENILLDIEKAIPCGIILNETVTNAIKHAYPNDKTGAIEVHLTKAFDKTCTLIIRDNGVGLPADTKPENPASMGLQLIVLLTEQLAGKLDISTEKGARFQIQFPL